MSELIVCEADDASHRQTTAMLRPFMAPHVYLIYPVLRQNLTTVDGATVNTNHGTAGTSVEAAIALPKTKAEAAIRSSGRKFE